MGVNGWRVADSDMHLMEPPDLWARYIDPAWRHAAPVGLAELHRDMRVRVKNHNSDPYRAGAGQPRRRDRGMEAATGLCVRPRRGAWVGLGRRSSRRWTPRASTSRCCSRAAACSCSASTARNRWAPTGSSQSSRPPIARAYNDWLHDFCAEDPARLLGAGLLAPHDIDAAVAETRRCVEELGFKTVMLYPGCVNRRAWHDPCYDPTVARVRTTRCADQLPRRRAELSTARLLPRDIRQR